jgi:hypothetical protein
MDMNGETTTTTTTTAEVDTDEPMK